VRKTITTHRVALFGWGGCKSHVHSTLYIKTLESRCTIPSDFMEPIRLVYSRYCVFEFLTTIVFLNEPDLQTSPMK
jgi:hypothetical protein